MNSFVNEDQRQSFLAISLATRREQRIGIAIGVVATLLALAVIPFVRVPMAKMPGFIPSYEAALFLIDLVTAFLLFDQFARLRSLAMLVLASGYLFDALIIIPHALSFPGAFTTAGLLGAGPQTTAWLYVFWHGGFPLFVIAYAFLRRRESAWRISSSRNAGSVIAAAIAGVVVLAIAFALLATWGHDLLPVVMQGGDYSLLVSKGISPGVWVLTLIALVLLWQRQQRTVDLWLMVVMWIWLFDIALAAVIGSSRFDLGFYAGRIFGLIASGFLLVSLLVEMAQFYRGAIDAAATAQQRLAQHIRLQSQTDTKPARPETFVSRQNIARYRALLQSEALDDDQRLSIERLLAEEERKEATARNSAD